MIAAAEPDASHDSLRRALTARWPTLPWRVAAPEDAFTMNDGIVDQSLTRVADNAASWLRQRIAEADGDVLTVWRRYKCDPSLLRTEFHGSTVWVFVPLGGGVADYVQLAVDRVQEVVLGPLVDSADWRRPYDADELCAGTRTESIEPKPATKSRLPGNSGFLAVERVPFPYTVCCKRSEAPPPCRQNSCRGTADGSLHCSGTRTLPPPANARTRTSGATHLPRVGYLGHR